MKSDIKENNSAALGSSTWLEPYRKSFLNQLDAQGYAASTRYGYERIISRFCQELVERCSQGPVDFCIAEAALTVARGEMRPGSAEFQVRRFVEHLVKLGVVARAETSPIEPTDIDRLGEEYRSYLHVQRGLSESTIHDCIRYLERFLSFRFGNELGDLNTISPADIATFLRQSQKKTELVVRKSAPSHLKNLFQFLFWSGKTQRNLAHCVVRSATARSTNFPRFLSPNDIEMLVNAVRSDAPIGRRNYAMFLLVARLGLRALEVIAIRLEDFDWRAGEILIRGKGKLHDRMPLPTEVGEAIVDYIRNGRASDSRTLFVSDRAPHRPFKDGQIVNYVLHKAFEITGLKSPQKYVGSHLFRHSLATNLLTKGASLEEIGHVLRHRSRMTTTIYAKSDLGALRSIAQSWPTEGGAQ